jgi:hypothetical protein
MNEWPPQDDVAVETDEQRAARERLAADAAALSESTQLESIAEDDRARAIERIPAISSFDELYLAIREIGTVTSTRSGESYDPETLIGRIEEARNALRVAYDNFSKSPMHKEGEPIPEISEAFIRQTKAFENITNTHGIRSAAIRLSLPKAEVELAA